MWPWGYLCPAMKKESLYLTMVWQAVHYVNGFTKKMSICFNVYLVDWEFRVLVLEIFPMQRHFFSMMVNKWSIRKTMYELAEDLTNQLSVFSCILSLDFFSSKKPPHNIKCSSLKLFGEIQLLIDMFHNWNHWQSRISFFLSGFNKNENTLKRKDACIMHTLQMLCLFSFEFLQNAGF